MVFLESEKMWWVPLDLSFFSLNSIRVIVALLLERVREIKGFKDFLFSGFCNFMRL